MDEVLELFVVQAAELEDLDGVRRVVEDHGRSRLVDQVLETLEVAHARQVADRRRDAVAANADRLLVRHLRRQHIQRPVQHTIVCPRSVVVKTLDLRLRGDTLCRDDTCEV